EGEIIRRGYDTELDALHNISRDGKQWMADYQAKEALRSGIGSLKVAYNQIDGYYLEVTHTHAAKVPAEYRHKKTLKNATRYGTPELQEYEEKVVSADEKIRQREFELFVALRERVAEQTSRLLQTAEVLATLDVLASLAEVAVSRGYDRPV